MKGPKLLYVAWIFAFAAAAAITLNGKRESTDFQGIAETREVIVNSENAVEIRDFHVLPGQVVKKGALLVEFDRPELTKKINEISHQLEESKVRRKADAGDAKARIRQLNAEKKAAVSEIDYKIERLKSQRELNKKLASGLKSIEADTKKKKTGNIKSQIDLQIESLEKERELAMNRIRLRIAAIQGGQNPVTVRIESLEKELDMLLREKQDLLIFSRIDGVIGSVRFKRGEKVTPFAPILTLYTKSPSYVKGYIHEKVYNRVTVGDEVQIVSLTGNNGNAGIKTGEVVGVGSRIVEYPPRLRKRPEINLWGREVQIRLPAENDFLLGEKVMILSPGNGKTEWTYVKEFFETCRAYIFGETAYAFGIDKATFAKQNAEPLEITMQDSPESCRIEASGLAYLADLDQFLVISDETPNKKPALYLMNKNGEIERETIIRGIESIEDMEAICSGEKNDIFIGCSQSKKSNGKVPESRQWLMKVVRDGSEFKVAKKIKPRSLLKTAAKKHKTAEWAKWLASGGDFDIDIEGMCYYRGDMYLGFKKPLKDGKAVIMRISRIDSVLAENSLSKQGVEIWKTFDFKDGNFGVAAGISDLQGLSYLGDCAFNEKRDDG